MLLIAAILLVAWLAGLLLDVGKVVHVLLLVGLMFLLLGLLKARDAAAIANRPGGPSDRA